MQMKLLLDSHSTKSNMAMYHHCIHKPSLKLYLAEYEDANDLRHLGMASWISLLYMYFSLTNMCSSNNFSFMIFIDFSNMSTLFEVNLSSFPYLLFYNLLNIFFMFAQHLSCWIILIYRMILNWGMNYDLSGFDLSWGSWFELRSWRMGLNHGEREVEMVREGDIGRGRERADGE